MQLFITHPLVFEEIRSLVDAGVEEDLWSDLCGCAREEEELCKKFSIAVTFDIQEEFIRATFPPQKITLNDLDMNELMYKVLYHYWPDLSLYYKPLGSTGCELSLSLEI